MLIPQPLEKVIHEIAKLPGIGKKTAFRLALHILAQPKENVQNLSQSISDLKVSIIHCERCFNISENFQCALCVDPQRNKNQICIVEDIRGIIAIEDTSEFMGLYHVLGGRISPVDGVGVEDLNIQPLLERISKETEVEEIIFAMSTTLESDTTVLYLYKKIKIIKPNMQFSVISRGVSVGENIEYVDSLTLGQSIVERVTYSG